MRYILNELDMQEIVEDLGSTLHYGINFFNQDGLLIASTDEKRIGISHAIAKEVIIKKETIYVTKDMVTDTVYQGINSPIIINGDVVGTIGITGIPSEVEQYASIIVKMTERYINSKLYFLERQHISKQNEVLINKVINGQELQFNEVEYINRKIDVTSGVQIAIVWFPDEITKLQMFMDKYRNDIICAQISDIVICILEESNKFFDNKQNFHVVIGSTQYDISALRYSYYKAYDIMRISNRVEIIEYEKLSIDLIYLTEFKYNRRLYDQKVLNKFDVKKLERYANIYLAYIKSGRSLKKTSATVLMHENTIQYQLQKITDITGLDFRNSDDSIFLYIAFNVYKIGL